MIGEINELQRLITNSKSKASEYQMQGILLSFGPSPSSFLLDYRDERYRWANLPVGLQDAVQDIVCRKGYGRIFDVAMNAAGGWVMQLKEGAKYLWGGELPERLEKALLEGQKREATISVFPSKQHLYAHLLTMSS
jgi:hypothetical protein